jgi:DNA polymerase-3 subunit epsilon
VDNSKRELHGALLDAGILVDVYLAMTGGQSALALDTGVRTGLAAGPNPATPMCRPDGVALLIAAASAEELRQHESMLDMIHKSSGGKALWRGGE